MQSLPVLLILATFSILTVSPSWAGFFEIYPWTDDESTGITPSSHWAYNLGTSDGAFVGSNFYFVPGISGTTPSNSHFSITGSENSSPDSQNNITDSGSNRLAANFIYNGKPGIVTLKGLSVGKIYTATFLSVGWNPNGGRNLTISSESDTLKVDQGHFGDNNGIRVDYMFTASASTRTLTFTPDSVGTWHYYAIALRKSRKVLVTTKNDHSNPGSLRHAIDNAQAGDVICFSPNTFNTPGSNRINLTNGKLSLNTALTIDASDIPGGVTLDISESITEESIMLISSSAQTIALRHLTLTGAKESAIRNYSSAINLSNSWISENSTTTNGGAISNLGGVVSLKESQILGNSAKSSGGGISNVDGILNLTNTKLQSNAASWTGGGINNTAGTVNIQNSSLSNNRAMFEGGGIYNVNGTVSLAYSTLSDGSAEQGAGLWSQSASTVTVSRCTFSGNSATLFGGGINNQLDSSLRVANSTFSGNTATLSGGGIVNARADLHLSHCTVSENTASARRGGGILNFNNGGNVVIIQDSIVAGNTAPLMNNIADHYDGGSKRIRTLSSGDPMLATLGDYGGTTHTMPPLARSPAIDAGLLIDSSDFDQRGFQRILNSTRDLGAVESGLPIPGLSDQTVVTSANDEINGKGDFRYSLRELLAFAPPGATLTFDESLSGETITLTKGQLVLDKPVTIDASNLDDGITIDAADSSRVLDIPASSNVILRSLTLTGGNDDFGGGIRNSGDLIAFDTTLTGNNSSVHGAGFYSGTDSEAILRRCTFSTNHATGDGGGAALSGAEVNFTNCTFSENSADDGGGIWSTGDSILRLQNSTVADNTAIRRGGGLRLVLSDLTLINSLIANNSAPNINEISKTAANNDIIRAGRNLIADNASIETEFPRGSPNAQGDFVGISSVPIKPLLAPLNDYGGSTQTMPPLPGSPAIDTGKLTALTKDQRGVPRPTGAGPDIGAVEQFFLVSPPLVDIDNDGIDDSLEGPDGPYPHLTVGTDDSALDSDGDGSPDAKEIGNRTNHFDANDFFRILSLAPTEEFHPDNNPLVKITIATFPGLGYQLETDPALKDFTPLPDGEFIADDFTYTLEVELTPGKDFIRVRRN